MSVNVCLSVSGLGFYCPVMLKNAPVGTDNLKKVLSCELFIQQFKRKMSKFRVENTSLVSGECLAEKFVVN